MTNGFQIAARFRIRVQLVGVACGMVLLLAGSACSPKVNRAVVGQWQNENGKETVVFREGGTLEGRDPYGRPITGTYEFIGSDRIRLNMTTTSVDEASGMRMVDNASGTCRFVVERDVLVLKEEGGAETRYRRANFEVGDLLPPNGRP